jgi:cyclophilin family peptidyl-prolyl cis-trans isomerase/HEAT repeat protein
MLLLWIPAALLAALAAAAAPPSRLAIVEAEAARASTPEQLQLLVRAATAPSPLQATAIRALGRLERPTLVETLVPLLESSQPEPRAEAAWALAQSAGRDAAAARFVRAALLRRLVGEEDPDVRGAIGEALGRLPLEAAPTSGPGAADSVEQALVAIASRVEITRRIERQAAGGRIVGLTLTPTREALVPLPALIGALRGLEALARAKARAQQTLRPETIERLRAIATDDPATSAARNLSGARVADAARARRLAILCLLPVGAVNAALVTRTLDDPDVQVRRLAVSAAAADRAAVERGLKDRSWLVRYEALRAYGRRFQTGEGCAPIVNALGVGADHVSLLAVDLLGNGCRPEDKAVERLLDLAASVTDPRADARGNTGAAPADGRTQSAAWQRLAHAIVALAKAVPDRARPYVARFLASEPWQSRMYGARAAAQVGDLGLLGKFAADASDNVREAAIAGLSNLAGHDADDVYVAALGANDYQLIITAAAALKGSPNRTTALPALLAALERLTTVGSDTSRDPRTALLERIRELGTRARADALRSYVTDFDPRVAEAAAAAVSEWTGTPVAAAPRPRSLAVPTLSDESLRQLEKTAVRITMSDGGQFDVKPLVDLAPVSSALFVERAARGYYTGLTFHRILPNFLIQGGSPGANEYMGDARFMVDEPGRASQARGTVGTSTRGRDTGDGQFYVNLVDTPRLDHEYSIFAEVVRGQDAVDRILEGDVMTKVEVLVK